MSNKKINPQNSKLIPSLSIKKTSLLKVNARFLKGASKMVFDIYIEIWFDENVLIHAVYNYFRNKFFFRNDNSQIH